MNDSVSDHVDEMPGHDEPGHERAGHEGAGHEGAGQDEPGQEEVSAGPTRLRMRRAPRYRAFGFTGTGLGIIAGVIVALSFSAASDYSTQTIAGYFAAILGLFGAVIGLGLAVLIERRRS